MPEPFKNEFNPKMISQMADHLAAAWPSFEKNAFVNKATQGLDSLELKERLIHISDALTVYLPNDFAHAVSVMRESLAPHNQNGSNDMSQGITGWGTLPLNHYISTHGLKHFDVSMGFLKEVTAHFSAEFDIRYFLIEDQERTLNELRVWTQDPNYHVRRLVSEGVRPRLPWAMKLQSFIDDPSLILPLLEALKDDEEEYVRRSVANNLNDIAKDHPDLVAEIAEAWLKDASKERKRLVKHACRTLIKQGHKATLEALGFGPPKIVLENLDIQTPRVTFGNALEFDLAMSSTSNQPQSLIIDYAIHHRKANGTTSPKVFKWKNITLKPNGSIKVKKAHTIKGITTRIYYNGGHGLEILVNGVSFAKRDFELCGV